MAETTSSAVASSSESRDTHDQLQPLIGRWSIDGQNATAAPVANGARVRGERHYEWLPGRFFIVGRWNHRFEAGGSHEGVYILGLDQSAGAPVSHNYDNLGCARDYRIEIDGRKWTLTGQLERATIEFAADGRVFDEVWEVLKDGAWLPLCEMHGTRI